MSNNTQVEEFIEEFRKEFEAEGGVCPDYPKYTAQPRDIEDYTDYLRTKLTSLLKEKERATRVQAIKDVETALKFGSDTAILMHELRKTLNKEV